MDREMDRKRDMRICEPEMALMMKRGNIEGAERAALGGGSHGINKAERLVYKEGGRVCKDLGGNIGGVMEKIGSGVRDAANKVGDWFHNTFHFDEGGEVKGKRAKRDMGGNMPAPVGKTMNKMPSQPLMIQRIKKMSPSPMTPALKRGGQAKEKRCEKAMGGVGKVRKGQYGEKSME